MDNSARHACAFDDIEIDRPRADTVILRCAKCGRRRIEMLADPGVIGVMGSPV